LSAAPRLPLLAAVVKTASFENIPLVERADAAKPPAAWRVSTSRSLETGFAAAEVVASVQADALPADDEALHLHVRASRNQTRWTPWMELAAWRGANAPELPAPLRPTQRDQLGRVEVDKAILAPSSMARFVQLRTVAHGAIAARGASLSARDQNAWNGSAVAPTSAFAIDPAAAPAPFRQHDLDPELGPRICSPCACAWAIRALARGEVDPLRLAAAAYDAANDVYGNWPRAVFAAGLRAFAGGVEGSLRFVGSIDEAAELIAGGAILVVSTRWEEGELPGAPQPRSAGNLMARGGTDAERGAAICFDPAQPVGAPFPCAYPLEAFAKAWLGKSAIAYVLRAPGGAK